MTRPHGEWSPNIATLLAGGRKLQGILGGGAAPQVFIPRLIDFWRAGRFPFDRLISVFPFENIADAWAAGRKWQRAQASIAHALNINASGRLP